MKLTIDLPFLNQDFLTYLIEQCVDEERWLLAHIDTLPVSYIPQARYYRTLRTALMTLRDTQEVSDATS